MDFQILWHERRNESDEISCDFWDCSNKIKTGDTYYFKEYMDTDGNGHTYCLKCSAFFILQEYEAFKEQMNNKVILLNAEIEGLSSALFDCFNEILSKMEKEE